MEERSLSVINSYFPHTKQLHDLRGLMYSESNMDYFYYEYYVTAVYFNCVL